MVDRVSGSVTQIGGQHRPAPKKVELKQKKIRPEDFKGKLEDKNLIKLIRHLENKELKEKTNSDGSIKSEHKHKVKVIVNNILTHIIEHTDIQNTNEINDLIKNAKPVKVSFEIKKGSDKPTPIEPSIWGIEYKGNILTGDKERDKNRLIGSGLSTEHEKIYDLIMGQKDGTGHFQCKISDKPNLSDRLYDFLVTSIDRATYGSRSLSLDTPSRLFKTAENMFKWTLNKGRVSIDAGKEEVLINRFVASLSRDEKDRILSGGDLEEGIQSETNIFREVEAEAKDKSKYTEAIREQLTGLNNDEKNAVKNILKSLRDGTVDDSYKEDLSDLLDIKSTDDKSEHQEIFNRDHIAKLSYYVKNVLNSEEVNKIAYDNPLTKRRALKKVETNELLGGFDGDLAKSLKTSDAKEISFKDNDIETDDYIAMVGDDFITYTKNGDDPIKSFAKVDIDDEKGEVRFERGGSIYTAKLPANYDASDDADKGLLLRNILFDAKKEGTYNPENIERENRSSLKESFFPVSFHKSESFTGAKGKHQTAANFFKRKDRGKDVTFKSQKYKTLADQEYTIIERRVQGKPAEIAILRDEGEGNENKIKLTFLKPRENNGIKIGDTNLKLKKDKDGFLNEGSQKELVYLLERQDFEVDGDNVILDANQSRKIREESEDIKAGKAFENRAKDFLQKDNIGQILASETVQKSFKTVLGDDVDLGDISNSGKLIYLTPEKDIALIKNPRNDNQGIICDKSSGRMRILPVTKKEVSLEFNVNTEGRVTAPMQAKAVWKYGDTDIFTQEPNQIISKAKDTKEVLGNIDGANTVEYALDTFTYEDAYKFDTPQNIKEFKDKDNINFKDAMKNVGVNNINVIESFIPLDEKGDNILLKAGNDYYTASKYDRNDFKVRKVAQSGGNYVIPMKATASEGKLVPIQGHNTISKVAHALKSASGTATITQTNHNIGTVAPIGTRSDAGTGAGMGAGMGAGIGAGTGNNSADTKKDEEAKERARLRSGDLGTKAFSAGFAADLIGAIWGRSRNGLAELLDGAGAGNGANSFVPTRNINMPQTNMMPNMMPMQQPMFDQGFPNLSPFANNPMMMGGFGNIGGMNGLDMGGMMGGMNGLGMGGLGGMNGIGMNGMMGGMNGLGMGGMMGMNTPFNNFGMLPGGGVGYPFSFPIL